MTRPSQVDTVLRFGVFEADLRAGELRRNGHRLRLQEKPFQLLAILLERPGEVVGKEELQQRLWPDVTVDADGGLNEAVYKLRQALEDSAQAPEYIETFPKRGYRFIAAVDAGPQAEPESPPQTTSQQIPMRKLAALLGGVALAGLAIGLTLDRLIFEELETRQPVRRWSIQPPERLRIFRPKPDVAISPNGRFIAWVDGGEGQLWVQDLQEERLRRIIPDVRQADNPFWSPDSEFLLFAASGELQRVQIQDGSRSKICKVERDLVGGTVSPDGSTVIFSLSTPARLFEVPLAGGTARPLHSDEEFARITQQLGAAKLSHAPHFLPPTAADRVLLFSVGLGSTRMAMQNLETGQVTDLGAGSAPVYSPSGHVLYRQNADLWAFSFSLDELKLKGEPFLVRQDATSLSVAGDGTLVYRDFLVEQLQLTVRDRSGRKAGDVGEPQPIVRGPLDISVEGRRILYMRGGEMRGGDLWIHDLKSDVARKVTLHPATDYSPVWSPDSRQIAFASNRDSGYDIFLKDPRGRDEPLKIAGDADREVVNDWSPDGKYLLYRRNRPATGADLWYLERSDNETWTARPFLEGPAREEWGDFSPDGRHVAYESNESGSDEVYITTFPEGQRSVQVSSRGGRFPRWNPQGGEVFYSEGTTLMSVQVSDEPEPEIGARHRLFDLPAEGGWEVFPDGERFLTIEPIGEPPDPVIHVVQNWHEEFRDRE